MTDSIGRDVGQVTSIVLDVILTGMDIERAFGKEIAPMRRGESQRTRRS